MSIVRWQRQSIFTIGNHGVCSFTWPEPMTADEVADVQAWLDIIMRRLGRTAVAQGIAAGTAETSAAQAPCEAQEPGPKDAP